MHSITLARRVLAVGALVALAGAAPAASSDTPEKPVVEKLLDILLQQQTITPTQYQELLAQARREQAAAAERAVEAAAAEPTPPGSAGPEEWSAKWDHGLRVERSDGAYKLRLGGRIHADGAVISETDGLNDDLRALGGDGQGNGVEFRRARLYLEGTLHEHLLFRAQYDFASGAAAFRDVYVGLRALGPVDQVLVGQFKEPFLLDEMTGDDFITMMERGLNDAFSPDRNVGVMATSSLADTRVVWQLGAFRDTDDFGSAFSPFGSTDWDVAARLTGLPRWEQDGTRLVHLGFDYVHRFRGQSTRFSQRPEANLADSFVDTGSIPASGVDIWNVELAAVYGPLAFQGEYSNALVDADHGHENVDFWAVYAQVSYFLTGEHKVYERDQGRFGRIKPNRSFDPARGDWGALEIAARFSSIDLVDGGIHGGRLWDAQGGLNWYLYANARVMLSYVHAGLSDRIAPAPALHVGGAGDIVQTRFGVDF